MGKAITWFSAIKVNPVERYVRFRHTKAYLRERSKRFQGPEANRHLMTACGYKNYEKFIRRRVEWNTLNRPVPLTYLAAIGAGLDVMALVAEADIEAYRAALALPLFPQYGTERLIAGFYRTVVFPRLTSEAEALTMLRAYSKRIQRECCLSFPDIKAVFIRPDGTDSTTYFPPTYRISGGFVMLGRKGSDIGTCRLG